MSTAEKDRLVTTDWSQLTIGQKIQHLEVEGYVVLPDLLSPEQVSHLRDELSHIPTKGVGYTDKKQVHNDIQWSGGAITELIALPPTIDFLTK